MIKKLPGVGSQTSVPNGRTDVVPEHQPFSGADRFVGDHQGTPIAGVGGHLPASEITALTLAVRLTYSTLCEDHSDSEEAVAKAKHYFDAVGSLIDAVEGGSGAALREFDGIVDNFVTIVNGRPDIALPFIEWQGRNRERAWLLYRSIAVKSLREEDSDEYMLIERLAALESDPIANSVLNVTASDYVNGARNMSDYVEAFRAEYARLKERIAVVEDVVGVGEMAQLMIADPSAWVRMMDELRFVGNDPRASWGMQEFNLVMVWHDRFREAVQSVARQAFETQDKRCFDYLLGLALRNAVAHRLLDERAQSLIELCDVFQNETAYEQLTQSQLLSLQTLMLEGDIAAEATYASIARESSKKPETQQTFAKLAATRV